MPRSTAQAGWKPHADKGGSRAVPDRFIEGRKTFALEYRGKAVSSPGIEKYDEERFPAFQDKRYKKIRYALSGEYRGQGLIPEAVREAIRCLFGEIGPDLIFCGYFLSSSRSGRVREKCGFRRYAFGTYQTMFGTVEEKAVDILKKEDWLSPDPDPPAPAGRYCRKYPIESPQPKPYSFTPKTASLFRQHGYGKAPGRNGGCS